MSKFQTALDEINQPERLPHDNSQSANGRNEEPGEFAVIDFETTGICANYCRIIEVAAAVIKNGSVTDSFTQLMNPGCQLPPFITNLTGITNSMLQGMPSPENVIPELLSFIGNRTCVAHNASFDAAFLHSEMRRAKMRGTVTFLCTMKLARRLIHDSPNYKLSTLANHIGLVRPDSGSSHRALYDVMLTVGLWNHIDAILRNELDGQKPDINIFQAVMNKPRRSVRGFLAAMRGTQHR